jgi:hypothetical protein
LLKKEREGVLQSKPSKVLDNSILFQINIQYVNICVLNDFEIMSHLQFSKFVINFSSNLTKSQFFVVLSQSLQKSFIIDCGEVYLFDF